jgi:DNA (cytosine-5)-methyltransferase 1
MRKKRLTLIDLFAGCGGLSLGLEQAGFIPVFVSELNADALATYLENRKVAHPHLVKEAFHCNDIKELVRDPKRLPRLRRRLKAEFKIEKGEVDLIPGGPPCQGFSGIGHRRSYSVSKEQLPSNHLFEDMAYVVHQIRPRAFLFENVRGLLDARWTPSGRKGEIWEQVWRRSRESLATVSRGNSCSRSPTGCRKTVLAS